MINDTLKEVLKRGFLHFHFHSPAIYVDGNGNNNDE